MQQWEYAMFPVDADDNIGDVLREWGDDGWELVQFWGDGATSVSVVFKRPKREGVDAGDAGLFMETGALPPHRRRSKQWGFRGKT
jgi:hypothetical protein